MFEQSKQQYKQSLIVPSPNGLNVAEGWLCCPCLGLLRPASIVTQMLNHVRTDLLRNNQTDLSSAERMTDGMQARFMTTGACSVVRATSINMVLGTDMKKHFDIMSRFQVPAQTQSACPTAQPQHCSPHHLACLLSCFQLSCLLTCLHAYLLARSMMALLLHNIAFFANIDVESCNLLNS